jgi:hypothetical protein
MLKEIFRFTKVKVLQLSTTPWRRTGSGSIAPPILDLGTRRSWVVSFTPRPRYPYGKSPWYPLDKRPGGLQSRSGLGDDDKNSEPLPGLEPPIIQPVARRYIAELYLHNVPLSSLFFTSSFLGPNTVLSIPVFGLKFCTNFVNKTSLNKDRAVCLVI